MRRRGPLTPLPSAQKPSLSPGPTSSAYLFSLPPRNCAALPAALAHSPSPCFSLYPPPLDSICRAAGSKKRFLLKKQFQFESTFFQILEEVAFKKGAASLEEVRVVFEIRSTDSCAVRGLRVVWVRDFYRMIDLLSGRGLNDATRIVCVPSWVVCLQSKAACGQASAWSLASKKVGSIALRLTCLASFPVLAG